MGGKHRVAAGSIWREDTDGSFKSFWWWVHFHFLQSGIVDSGATSGKGSNPFPETIYIYITVITSATALHCKVKLHQVPLFLQAVVFGEFPWSTESKSRPHSLPGAAGTLRGAHQVLGVPRD